MLEQRLGQPPEVGVRRTVVGDLAQRRRDRGSSEEVSSPASARTCTNPSHRLGSSSRRARRCFSSSLSPRNRFDVPRVLGAGEELQLTELHRLEAARGGEPLPELQEVLRRHRLQHVDLLDQHPLDDVHPVEQVAREPEVPAAAVRLGVDQRVPDRLGLVQQLLEPQLVDLVDRDEEQLVVRRRLATRGAGRREAVPGAGSCRRSAVTAPAPPPRRTARSSRLPCGQPMRCPGHCPVDGRVCASYAHAA